MASGIYCIRHAGGRVYVGSAVNIKRRLDQHKLHLKKGCHHAIRLQRAWDKYGADAFSFEILEAVEDKGRLIAVEQHWLDKLSASGPRGFNSYPVAGSRFGVKHTPETREKLRLANIGRKQTPETIAKRAATAVGKKHRPEVIAARMGRKPSEAALGKMRGRKLTEEHREKLSAAKTGIKFTDDHKENLRNALLGRVISPEHRASLSEAGKGKKQSPDVVAARTGKKRGPYNITPGRVCIGHPQTTATRMKISAGHAGRKKSPETIQNMIAAQNKWRSNVIGAAQ